MRTLEPGSIIVAVDGSPEADRAVQWAAEQARLEHRPLVVATAVEPVIPAPSALAPVPMVPADDLVAQGKPIAEAAAALARKHRPELDVRPFVSVGNPRDVLVDLSVHAHLLVLGSRGRGPIRSKLLGSVSARVSKAAQCPVVVCRPGTELTVKRGVIVGADGTPESLPVIDFAFRHAALHDQPLTIVHCFWDELAAVDSPRLVHPSEAGLEDIRLRLAESVAGFRERYPEVHVTLQLARGHAVDYLSAVADQHDCVVMGRHRAGNLLRRLTGPASTAVTESAHTSVAIVPEDRAA